MDAQHRRLHRHHQAQFGTGDKEAARQDCRPGRNIGNHPWRAFLWSGEERTPAEAFEALAQFTIALEIAAFGADAASLYGDVRASLAKRGTPIGPLDTLIAAHALQLDLVLVTHNIREFSRIDGLRLEDWVH